eukprot:4328178-Pleurochrysis_carterae.AAC.10
MAPDPFSPTHSRPRRRARRARHLAISIAAGSTAESAAITCDTKAKAALASQTRLGALHPDALAPFSEGGVIPSDVSTDTNACHAFHQHVVSVCAVRCALIAFAHAQDARGRKSVW